MYLSREEERIYDGDQGWANQTCIKILARLGDLFKAEKLIPIDSAHISGISYKTLGDAPIEFLRALADADGRVKVRTTLNPSSLDHEYLAKRIPTKLSEKQSEILNQFERLGASESLTCTPYYLQKPKQGSHLAWAESSAVVYANSVLGTSTNREGGPSALAAAIIGKTPNYGIHKSESRMPDISIDVKTRLRNEIEFGLLGICLGKILQDKIPLVKGLQNASKDELKQFSAGLATSGMTNMFIFGSRMKNAMKERVTIEAENIKRAHADLSTAQISKPDLIFLGCPHCSADEIRRIACIARGKKIRGRTELWVCTSEYVKKKAALHVKEIEKSGGHVLAGVCTVVSWTEKLGIETIMTNSAKTAYYAPTLNKALVSLAPLEVCLKAAVKG